MFGWHGCILEVDLTTGRVSQQELPMARAQTWLGGRGLGALLLYERVGPGVDALGEDNVIIIVTGPLTGTRVPTAGRVSLTTKSPLTGTILDSNAGGVFGARLKACGYDAVVITGRSPEPVWLEIMPGGAVMHSARDMWGLDTRATARRVTASMPGAGSLGIGPAGENLVRFASVCVDGRRACGRGGAGAVMGAKNLKAVTARGRVPVRIAGPERLAFVLYETEKTLQASPVTMQALPEFGTAVLVNLLQQAGALPAYNYREAGFAQAGLVSGEAITDQLLVKRYACYRCPIGCGRITRTTRSEGEGPEYETVWALGPDLGISDLETIAEANYLCNRLGLDTISTGGTLACAAELTELGLLPEGPRFGAAGDLLGWVEKIAYRRDLGDLLAAGARRLAGRLGAPQVAMQVKGMELPAYDPRGLKGQGLAYATSNRGGCHLRANMLGPEILGTPKRVDRFAWPGKAGLVIVLQHSHAVLDSLVLCKFTSFALADEHYARLASAVTGVDYRPQDLQKVGERIWNLERLYNWREGFRAVDDTLPPRLVQEPVKQGPGRGQVVELEPMLREYYRFRGWREDGSPGPSKLRELGLEGLAGD